MMKNRLLDKKEVCEILKISVGSLDGMMKRGEINYIKFNRSVRFEIDEVISVINENVVDLKQ